MLLKTLILKLLKTRPRFLPLNELLQRCTFYYNRRKNQTGNSGIFITAVVLGEGPLVSCCCLIGGHKRCSLFGNPDGAVSALTQQQIKFLKKESKGLGTELLPDDQLVHSSETAPETLPWRNSVSLEMKNSCKSESGPGEQLLCVWLRQFWRAEHHEDDR